MTRGARLVRWVSVPAVVWALYFLRANVWFRLYPVAVVSVVLAVFAWSLSTTPLVERIARRSGAILDGRGVRYCRRVTQAWVLFLVAHLCVTVFSVFASYEFWAWYNGGIAYLLMGAMFVGEWLVRKRRTRHG